MSKKRKPVIQHAPALAERDGGWFCHYCGIKLLDHWENAEWRNISLGNGRFVWTKDNREYFTNALVDHVIPAARGGTDQLDNLVLSCSYCNCRKGARPYDEFIKTVARVSHE